MQLRDVRLSDAAAICEIYNHYIQHTAITFETVALREAEMRERIKEAMDSDSPYYVAEAEGKDRRILLPARMEPEERLLDHKGSNHLPAQRIHRQRPGKPAIPPFAGNSRPKDHPRPALRDHPAQRSQRQIA